MLTSMEEGPFKLNNTASFGLSLCKQIIAHFNGDIGFSSLYEEGSEFVFKFDMELANDECTSSKNSIGQ